jgi:hypothetical protein
MRFFLVARDRGDGSVRLLDPSVYSTKEDALDAVGEGPSAGEDLFVVDLDVAAPVLMVRAPQAASSPMADPPAEVESEPVYRQESGPEPEPEPMRDEVAGPERLPARPSFFHLAPEPVEMEVPEPVAEPVMPPVDQAAWSTPPEPAPPVSWFDAPRSLEMEAASPIVESEDAVVNAEDLPAPPAPPVSPSFADALRGASEAMRAAGPDTPTPEVLTPHSVQPVVPIEPDPPANMSWLEPERPPADTHEVSRGEPSASAPSSGLFSFPAPLGAPGSTPSGPPAGSGGRPIWEPKEPAVLVPDAAGAVTDGAESDVAPEPAPVRDGEGASAPVGREDLAAALEQLAAVAQFSSGLKPSDMAGTQTAAEQPAPPAIEESPITQPTVVADAAAANESTAVTSQPSGASAPGIPGSPADPNLTITTPLGQPATQPPFIPSKEDVARWTCAECVYVTTCPRSGQDRPTTCGSFQWRTG